MLTVAEGVVTDPWGLKKACRVPTMFSALHLTPILMNVAFSTRYSVNVLFFFLANRMRSFSAAISGGKCRDSIHHGSNPQLTH